MNFTLRFLLAVSLLVITAHRLPAPIQEVPETPTPTPPVIAPPATVAPTPGQPTPAPTPAVQAKAKKTSTKAKAKPAESEAAKPTAHSNSTVVPAVQGPAKFAGTWTGTITQPTSTGRVTLLFNATATSVTLAGRERPATVNGNTISWRSGMLNGNAWTLTPNPDGKTAQVTIYSGPLGQWSATFYRDQGSQPPAKKPGP